MLIKSILSGNNSYRQMFIRWSITKGQTHFFFKWKKEESLNLFFKSHSYFLVVFYRDIINYRTIMLYVITSKLSKCKQLSPSKEHTYVAQICSKNKFNLAHGAVIHNIPEVCAYICTVSKRIYPSNRKSQDCSQPPWVLRTSWTLRVLDHKSPNV